MLMLGKLLLGREQFPKGPISKTAALKGTIAEPIVGRCCSSVNTHLLISITSTSKKTNTTNQSVQYPQEHKKDHVRNGLKTETKSTTPK